MGHQDLVQVLNIAPSATPEQLRTLFGYLGRIDDLVLYPIDDRQVPSKVAYLRFHESENPSVALHLNNTVFIDRALIVLALPEMEAVPEEDVALRFTAPQLTTAGVLPRSADWPVNVVSMVVGRPGEQIIQTFDLDLPVPYPALPATTDANRIEEIRRTVLITNLDASVTGEQVLEFMQPHGDIKYIRMAQSEGESGAFVEFAEQQSVVKALGQSGATLNGCQILVQHATCCIIKPASVYGQAIDAGIKKMKEAQDPTSGSAEHTSVHSRSRSRGSRRHKTRSRSRDRRRRSRSRDKDRRRRSSRDRSRDRDRHKRDRERRRSGSRSRDRRRRRSRSRSRERRKHTRRSSRSRERGRNDKKRSRSRSPAKDKERSSRNGHRSGRSGDKRDPKEDTSKDCLDSPIDRSEVKEKGGEEQSLASASMKENKVTEGPEPPPPIEQLPSAEEGDSRKSVVEKMSDADRQSPSIEQQPVESMCVEEQDETQSNRSDNENASSDN